MERALIAIISYLRKAGLSEREVDHLLARFLEEEAYDYVEAMKELEEYFEKKREDNNMA